MRWKVCLNASVSKILGNNYKEIENHFDAKYVTIPFQGQTAQLDEREMSKKQQFRFDALRSQDAENARGEGCSKQMENLEDARKSNTLVNSEAAVPKA